MKLKEIFFIVFIYILIVVPICLFLFMLRFVQFLLNMSFIFPNWFLSGFVIFTVLSPFVLFIILLLEGKLVLKFYQTRLNRLKNNSLEKVYKYKVPEKMDVLVDKYIEQKY